MSSWAGIVYGRTYEVDFRFITVPQDFTNEDRDWAGSYIRVTTRAAEQLPENPRWSLFKNEEHCVVGVTCMLRELLSPLNETTEQFTKDSQGRPLYVFVGYVAKADEAGNFPPIPPYSGKNLELFKQLWWTFVERKWLVKPYDTEGKMATPSSYEELTDSSPTAIPDLDRDYYSLNQMSHIAGLWPDVNTREGLWTAVTQQIAADPHASLSLCLGVATRKDVLESPVLNATVADVRQKELVEKPLISPQPELPTSQGEPVLNERVPRVPQQVEQQPRERNVSREHSQSGRRTVQVLGALGGGVALAKLGGIVGRVGGIAGPIPGAVGFAGGVVVGWFIASLLDEATRGEISQRTGEVIHNCSEAVFNSREQEQPDRNYRSGVRNHGMSQPQDSSYGFRRRDEQTNSESSSDNDSTWNL
ncbi:MAG: hypothetical protein SAK29_34910 [Scytonema sp. PMC 1069.18]|nr:hypothetical protein [Scytonema sp. PMC 1069.18]MEC4880186.1 hypothetical protein [Scytonema sp. PMC 1070.18]